MKAFACALAATLPLTFEATASTFRCESRLVNEFDRKRN